jgi:hypothetical protein
MTTIIYSSNAEVQAFLSECIARCEAEPNPWSPTNAAAG